MLQILCKIANYSVELERKRNQENGNYAYNNNGLFIGLHLNDVLGSLEILTHSLLCL